MLKEIKSELQRLDATNTVVVFDEEFEPEVGKLLKVVVHDAYWHLFPDRFLAILKDLPNAAGSKAIHLAIEQKALFVWHGPSPKESRDASP